MLLTGEGGEELGVTMGCNNSDLEMGPSGATFRVKADLKELRRKRESGVERGR